MAEKMLQHDVLQYDVVGYLCIMQIDISVVLISVVIINSCCCIHYSWWDNIIYIEVKMRLGSIHHTAPIGKIGLITPLRLSALYMMLHHITMARSG